MRLKNTQEWERIEQLSKCNAESQYRTNLYIHIAEMLSRYLCANVINKRISVNKGTG